MSRTALVTGGTRGIGLGIARALARDGWSLALCGMRAEGEVGGTVEDETDLSGFVQEDTPADPFDVVLSWPDSEANSERDSSERRGRGRDWVFGNSKSSRCPGCVHSSKN